MPDEQGKTQGVKDRDLDIFQADRQNFKDLTGTEALEDRFLADLQKKEDELAAEEGGTEEPVIEEVIPEEGIEEEKKEGDVVEEIGDAGAAVKEAVEEEVTEKDAEKDGMNDDELEQALLDEITDMISKNDTAQETTEELKATIESDEVIRQSPAYQELRTKFEQMGEEQANANVDLQQLQNQLKAAEKQNSKLVDQAVDTDIARTRMTPFVESLEDNPKLKETVVLMTKMNKQEDGEQKEAVKTQAIDALYDLVEEVSGVDVRSLVNQEGETGKDAFASAESEAGAGGLGVEQGQTAQGDSLDQKLRSSLNLV